MRALDRFDAVLIRVLSASNDAPATGPQMFLRQAPVRMDVWLRPRHELCRKGEQMNQRWNSSWNELDRFFATLSPYSEPLFTTPRIRRVAVAATPETRSVSVEERAQEIVLMMAIPGLSERDVKVSLADNVVTIEGKREISVPHGYAAIRRERSETSFSHRMELPTGIDSERASAVVKHGILTLTLPKHASALPKEIVVRGEN